MPNSPTHDAITHVVAAATGAIAGSIYGWRYGLVSGAACWFSGWMLSADLDLNSAPSNRWGPLEFIWWPYRAIADHRGFSHWIIVGVLSRLAYLYGALVLLGGTLFWFARYIWPGEPARISMEAAIVTGAEWPMSVLSTLLWSWSILSTTTYQHAGLVWAGLIGAEIGGESHIVADLIGSRIKKNKKPTARPARRKMRKAA